MELALLNTTIATSNGSYELHDIDLSFARSICHEAMQKGGVRSYVGHKATAQIMSALFGFTIEVDRSPFAQEGSQGALCLKLGKEGEMFRAEEGRIYTIEEMEQIGYSFKLLLRLPDACRQPSDLEDLIKL